MPIDEYSEHALPLSGMNRELLSKAEDMGKSGQRDFYRFVFIQIIGCMTYYVL